MCPLVVSFVYMIREYDVSRCSPDIHVVLFTFQMSHLFTMFVKQVQDYCGSLSMPGEFLQRVQFHDFLPPIIYMSLVSS
jgi:hypothetical protein